MNTTTETPAKRIPLNVDIEFRKNYARDVVIGQLKNISLTGAFLATDSSDLKPNDKIKLTVIVGSRKRTLHAWVIWANHNGAGLKFNPSNNQDVQIIDDLMYFAENDRNTKRTVLGDIFDHVEGE